MAWLFDPDRLIDKQLKERILLKSFQAHTAQASSVTQRGSLRRKPP